MVDLRRAELETAKELLAEIFQGLIRAIPITGFQQS